MIINHNMASVNTLRQMGVNEANTAKSLAKLSSGLRINSSADDAAGLAISEKMRGQIRGLDQATRNSQDGISLLKTAEGALNETHSILQRMRELAVQSSTDTNTAADRTNIQSEMSQLTSEVERISAATQFNTKNLLDGSMGAAVSTAVANIQGNSSILGTAGAALADTTALLTSLTDSSSNTLGIVAGDTIDVSFVVNGSTTEATQLTVSSTSSIAAITALISGAAATAASGTINLTASVVGFAGAVNGVTITVKDSSGNIRNTATNALSSFTETTAAADVQANGQATLAIGANQNQTLNIRIDNMSASALGVSGLSVETQASANVAIQVVDSAIAKVSVMRSNLGALENRLEHTINNLGTSSENLTAAESRIRDVDLAKEMTNFQKNNILSQASQAMLAQANQQPQGVLQLLR